MKKITLFIVVFLMSGFLYAHNHGGDMDGKMGMHMGMNMGMMGEHMDEMVGACLSNAEELKLTDEQIAKLQPLHREMQKKQAKFKAEIKVAELELAEVMDVKDFDLAKAEQISKKIAELRLAYHSELLKLMKDVRSILSEEQFQKMKKMKMMGMMKKPAMKHGDKMHKKPMMPRK